MIKTQLLPLETVRSTGQEETISNCVKIFQQATLLSGNGKKA